METFFMSSKGQLVAVAVSEVSFSITVIITSFLNQNMLLYFCVLLKKYLKIKVVELKLQFQKLN